MSTITMPPAKTKSPLEDFPPAFRGTQLRPGDEGYAASREIFNGRTAADTPALIVKPVDEADVATVLRFASAHNLPVAVRGGGHGIDGTAMPDKALVLDMSGFKTIEVDAEKGIIRAGAGVLLSEIDAAGQLHGLVVPSGTVTSTGIAGLTLGGGIGMLMRRFGATVDHLLSCTLVSLEGEIVTANATENTELFWGLRGGGGNFGVVTTFEYRTQRLDHDVFAGMMAFPFDQASGILVKLSAWMPDAPRELGLLAALLGCPPMPGVPPEAVGQPVLIVAIVYSGRPETAGPTLDYLNALGTPFINMVQPMPWVAANALLDAVAPFGRATYTRGGYLPAITEAVAVTFCDSIVKAPPARVPGPSAMHLLFFLGGAISQDFEEDSTAFSREGAGLVWEGTTTWDNPDPELAAALRVWSDAVADALPLKTNSYSNLSCDQGAAWRRGLWGSAKKLNRLRAIKAKWDPHNLFRYNKNIPME